MGGQVEVCVILVHINFFAWFPLCIRSRLSMHRVSEVASYDSGNGVLMKKVKHILVHLRWSDLIRTDLDQQEHAPF
jgi:hypothetical protein